MDDVIVSFTIPGRIHDELWDAFVADIMTQRPRYCVLLCLGRVEVDAAQRRRSTHAFVRTRSSVIVVTDNRMTRGLVMTVAWLGAKLDAFTWPELPRALDGLEIAEGMRMRLLHDAQTFHAALSHIDG